MHTGVLRVLAFDRIVEVVRSFAVTPLGSARLAALRPSPDPQRVAQLLGATTETARYVQEQGAFPLTAPTEIETILSVLAVEGRALEAVGLIGLADFLDSVDESRNAVRRQTSGYPILRALVEPGASFKPQVAEVRRQIAPGGEVVDSASPQLRTIRERLRKQRLRLRGTLESYLRSKDTSRYLQEQVLAERNGRLVLVIRAEHRAAIPGIIHGSSGSGASLYLEPLSTVEINNDTVALEEQEAEEVRRILLALTDGFRGRALDLQRTIEVATELDVLQAKARASALVDGVAPTLSPDGRLELRGARHPLLMPVVLARLDEGNADKRSPVPIDLVVIPPTRVLLVTGPNTGGKTVALKTAGLLSLMAQAGLHVPALVASLPVFRSVFADIGDEQSIAASLSTFSGHITNIAAMDRALNLPALVLLDEIGAGTDPSEGGALGVAIIDHFKQRGALVMSTTHYDALKTYAARTGGVTCAAFGFDPETFEPTFKLMYGSPGRSLAFEVAARIGLSAPVIAAARANLSAEQAQLAEHLAKVDADLRALDHDRRLVQREREALEQSEQRVGAREESLRQREASSHSRLNQALDQRLREAHAEIDAVLAQWRRRAAEIEAQAGRRAAASLSTGEVGAARSGAREAVGTVIQRLRPAAPETAPDPAAAPVGRSAGIGDRVVVGNLGMEGVVVLVHDREADVEVRGKRVRAQLAELRVLDGRTPPAPAHVNVSVHVGPRHGSLTELNLLGSTVDDALTRVEKFLDESLLTEQRSIRLIHGYGTGQLRRALAVFLQGHPLVASFQPASSHEGGGGVTVVELKD